MQVKGKGFIVNTLKGGAIGVAMIIPGVSGGTLAVLMDVYDGIIGAIGNIRKDFKGSVKFLFPILLGAVLAFAAMFFPLKFALEYAPLPTVMLFAGLMAGSCPKLISDCRKNGFKKTDIIAIIIPFIVVIGICFIPGMGTADLSADMPRHAYVIVALVGVLASCALVVPGISGSMLLMLFGYYEPLLNTFSSLLTSPLHAIAVLGLFALGLLAGFFTIAKLMNFLLGRFPRTTYWAILGFVLGSIPAIMIVFDYAGSPLDWWQILIGVVLFIAGGVGSCILTARLAQKAEEKADTAEN